MNNTNNLYTGILFSGQNTVTWLLGNTIQNHNTGLRVKDGAIAPQVSFFSSIAAKNKWTGSYNSYSAHHYNPTDAQNSQQIYYPQGTALGTPMRPNSASPAAWFQSSSNSFSMCCDVSCKTDGLEDEEADGLDNLQRSIANKELHFPQYDAEQQWQAEEQLFRDLQQANRQLINELISADSLLAVAVSENERKDAQEQLNSIRRQIDENTEQLNQLSKQLNIYLQQRAEELISDNAQIKAENTVPQNEKLFNEVWLHTKFQNHTKFTPQQIQTLEYLAFQCPLQGGQAVYKARSLYAIVKDTVYDDNHLCNAVERSNKTDENTSNVLNKEVNVFVFPNPAENTVSVSINGKVIQAVKLEWYDALGRLVQTNELPATESLQSTYQVQTTALQNGIYQLVVKEKNIVLYSGKLVITK